LPAPRGFGPKAFSVAGPGELRAGLDPAGRSPSGLTGRPAGLPIPRGFGAKALPAAGLATPRGLGTAALPAAGLASCDLDGFATGAWAGTAPAAGNSILGFSVLRLNSRPLRPITWTSSAPTPPASRAMASAGSSGQFLSTLTLMSSRLAITPAAPSTTAVATPALPICTTGSSLAPSALR